MAQYPGQNPKYAGPDAHPNGMTEAQMGALFHEDFAPGDFFYNLPGSGAIIGGIIASRTIRLSLPDRPSIMPVWVRVVGTELDIINGAFYQREHDLSAQDTYRFGAYADLPKKERNYRFGQDIKHLMSNLQIGGHRIITPIGERANRRYRVSAALRIVDLRGSAISDASEEVSTPDETTLADDPEASKPEKMPNPLWYSERQMTNILGVDAGTVSRAVRQTSGEVKVKERGNEKIPFLHPSRVAQASQKIVARLLRVNPKLSLNAKQISLVVGRHYAEVELRVERAKISPTSPLDIVPTYNDESLRKVFELFGVTI